MGTEVQEFSPCLAVERGLLVQQNEVRVKHHVARFFVIEHVHAVLRDARAYQVEFAALSPKLAEVRNDGGVPKQALHLVDVKPRRNPTLEVVIHAVAHRFEHRDDAKGTHVFGEVFKVDVGNAAVEGDVGFVVEKRKCTFNVAFITQGDIVRLLFGLFRQNLVEVFQQRKPINLRALRIGRLNTPTDDGFVCFGESLAALGHRCR